MQTFLPRGSFQEIAQLLDYRRLGKQRVEAKQIIDTIAVVQETRSLKRLDGKKNGWATHPCILMWYEYLNCLKLYYNVMCQEWEVRGYCQNMPYYHLDDEELILLPLWLFNTKLRVSHESNLVRKDPDFYGPKFPGVPDNLPYIWPITLENREQWKIKHGIS